MTADVDRDAPTAVAEGAGPALRLPRPPTDEEKYWYMGRQHRWLLAVQGASFALIAYSMARFAATDPLLLLFLVPMSLYAVTLVVSVASAGSRKRTDLWDHELRVTEYRPERFPTVDVFLPTAGEPLEVLRNTYEHVRRLEWPGEVRVLVLDDGGREEVRELAAEHGFTYGRRADRGRLKKAGNLRYGFQHSDGELVVVLDADFVPRPDFLRELVPYFEDETVGIVQSPQFFDTSRDMHWLQRCAGATQELFYRWIQPARDRAGAAICVGTCAIYRRSALDRAGGFAEIGHSEDVHTGVALVKAGYQLRYVPIIVSKGLCPDNLAGFLNQQYRWCAGSMSLLADKAFRTTPDITPRQRLCFWAGFLYYISTAVNAFVAPLPSLVMLYYIPRWIEPANSVWLAGAFLLWFVVLPLVSKSRWRIEVLRVQLLYSFAHAAAILHAITGRTRSWVATGASVERTTPLATGIARTAKAYIAVTQLLVWVGLTVGILEHGLERFWAMVLVAVVGAYVQLPILFLPVTAPAPRPEPRRVVVLPEPRSAPTAGTLPATSAPLSAPAPARPVVDAVSAPAAERRFRPDIQGLRAVAVLLVLLYHAEVPGVTGGYVGVDVFFVISGFLITGQLLREAERSGRVSLTAFYAGRIRRLLPSALIVLAVTVVAVRVWDNLLHVRTVSLDALASLVYVVNYRLAAQGIDYQQSDVPPSPLQHFWSLAVEEQFYLLWPLLVLACAVLARRHLRPALGVTLVVVIALSLHASVTTTETNAPLAYFSLQTRAWELGLGAVVALRASRLRSLPVPVAAASSWAGLVAIVWSGLAYDDSTPFPGSAALVPVLGAALVVAGGCRLVPGGAEAVLGLRAMQGMGAVSYAWYLWHWPMLVLAPLMTGVAFGWGVKLLVVLLALWAAVLTYWVVEDPTRRSRLRTRAWLGTGLGLSGAVAATTAAVMVTMPTLVGTGAAVSAVRLSPQDQTVLRTALDRGIATERLPVNLTPAVGAAIADVPDSSRADCHLDFLEVAHGPCAFGDLQGERTMVVFGDSHAQQWLGALLPGARREGWKVVSWTKSACPLADLPVDNPTLRREYTECAEWRGRMLERIAALRPDVVVTSQSDTVPWDRVSDQDWADGTQRTLAALRRGAERVVFVGDTPYPTYDVAQCLADNIDDAGACVYDRDEAYRFPDRHVLVGAAAQQAGARYVDPIDWFCREECPAVVGNMSVYRDMSHMTNTYSTWLAPMVRSLFSPAA
jgi:peptidoglycan/LPS O-acetylase OafA/YrhL/cellulose synthase/poly-beta-1,6-N-acetylglucosamine synthase-like glycosyltransferase